jgi:hypothetical protein
MGSREGFIGQNIARKEEKAVVIYAEAIGRRRGGLYKWGY